MDADRQSPDDVLIAPDEASGDMPSASITSADRALSKHVTGHVAGESEGERTTALMDRLWGLSPKAVHAIEKTLDDGSSRDRLNAGIAVIDRLLPKQTAGVAVQVNVYPAGESHTARIARVQASAPHA